MIRLVRIELLKLRTTPAAYVALGVSALLAVAGAVANILLAGQSDMAPLGSAENVGKVLAIGAVTSIAMLILGIMISAGEDRHRTILGTYLAEPRRGRVLLAKLVTAALVGAVGGALIFGLALAIAVPLYAAKGVHHLPVDVAALWLGTTLITACFGLLGVALGALTRNTVAAIVGALVWVVVIELAILQPLFPSLAKWLPTGAGVALTPSAPTPRRCCPLPRPHSCWSAGRPSSRWWPPGSPSAANCDDRTAGHGVRRARTSSCRCPLVASALPPDGPSVPSRAVNRPPGLGRPRSRAPPCRAARPRARRRCRRRPRRPACRTRSRRTRGCASTRRVSARNASSRPRSSQPERLE